jgi:hypothetical protein
LTGIGTKTVSRNFCLGIQDLENNAEQYKHRINLFNEQKDQLFDNMSWLGANEIVASRKRLVESEDHETVLSKETDDNTNNHRRSSHNWNNETVEAALNRLSKAYATAMECVGALHRANDATLKNKSDQCRPQSTTSTGSDSVSVEILSNLNELNLYIGLARAARNLFENSILLDPLISTELAPTICHTLTKLEDDENDRYDIIKENDLNDEKRDVLSTARKRKRQSTIMLNSIGNKSTIQSIAYYALVNYGDLLVACIPPPTNSSTVLDRGVVKSLGAFHLANPVWNREIVVVNDADGTGTSDVRQTDGASSNDAVTGGTKGAKNENEDWINQSSEGPNIFSPNLSSEKYKKCLLDENEENILRLALVSYIDATAIDGTDPTVWLKLACAARRLGQILIHQNNTSIDSNLTNSLTSSEYWLRFRSLERHALEMSILCVGPNEVPNRTALRAIQELNTDIYDPYDNTSSRHGRKEFKLAVDLTKHSWLSLIRFVFNSCKTGVIESGFAEQPGLRDSITSPLLSFTLPPLLGMPSLALQLLCSFLDHSDLTSLQNTCTTIRVNVDFAKTHLIHANSTINNEALKTKEKLGTATTNTDPTNPDVDLPSMEKELKIGGSGRSSLTNRPASRVSSRVRSQMAASEKRAERNSRRQSIRYCLVAAVFGVSCDDERYQEAVENAMARDGAVFAMLSNGEKDERCHDFDQHSEGKGLNGITLARFFNVWKQNEVSSPIDLLFFVLSHLSIHVSDVFPANISEAETLSSLILECKSIFEYIYHF